MFENEKSTDPRMESSQYPRPEHREQDGCAMRALTPIELHAIEQKHAQELQFLLRSFLGFPTPQNFQRMQEASTAYMQAWMNGRRRVLD